jgi:hypothetical protein
VLVTACAPAGRPRARPAAEHEAMRRLRTRVARCRRRALAAEGSDEAGRWREPSLLVALRTAGEAKAWGQAVRQNAVLAVPRRGRVRLVLLR